VGDVLRLNYPEPQWPNLHDGAEGKSEVRGVSPLRLRQPGNRFVRAAGGRVGGAVLSEHVFVAASASAPRAASRRNSF